MTSIDVTQRLRRIVADRTSLTFKRRVRLWQVALRRPTASLRQTPSFLLAGAMRAGTTSLFRYLSGHPDVRRSARKEIDYFSTDAYGYGWDWYLAHFPLRAAGGVCFEATPQYLVHPRAAERIARHLPETRVVVTLRDPAARARSHHRWMTELGMEPLEYVAALEAEQSRIGRDLALLDAGSTHTPTQLLRHSYLTRSMYASQLQRYEEHLHTPLIVFDFEAFLREPEREWGRLLESLELAPWTPPSFANWSRRGDAPTRADDAWRALPPTAREALEADWQATQERWLPHRA